MTLKAIVLQLLLKTRKNKFTDLWNLDSHFELVAHSADDIIKFPWKILVPKFKSWQWNKLVHKNDPNSSIVIVSSYSNISLVIWQFKNRKKKHEIGRCLVKEPNKALSPTLDSSIAPLYLWTLFCPFHDSIHKNTKQEWELVIYMQHIYIFNMQ